MADTNTFDPNESIESVIERYKSTVYGVALSYTQNAADADDIFQETFLAYYKSAPVFNEEEHRKAWIITTAKNCSLRVVTSTSNRKVDTTDQIETVSDENQNQFQFKLKEENDVWVALQSLPEKFKTVLYLFYFEDLPVESIAKMLDLNPGAVRARMKRGREMLKVKLEEAGYGA